MDDEPWLLGIDVGGTKVALATGAPDGTLHTQTRFLIDEGAPVDSILADIRTHVREFTRRPPVCVGVSTPGVVEPTGVRFAPNNPGWDTVALEPSLSQMLECPRVQAVTDVKAACFAEVKLGALRHSISGLYVNIGTGVSAAIALGGRVLVGPHKVAGEIAYQSVHGTSRDSSPKVAPFEEQVSGRGLADQVSRAVGRRLSTREAFALAETDPAARNALRERLQLMADHVADLAVALDTDTIVIGGGMATAPGVLESLCTTVNTTALFPVHVQLADFPQDAPLRGALLAAAGYLEPGPLWL